MTMQGETPETPETNQLLIETLFSRLKALPLSHHANEDSQECNQKSSMLPCQSDCRTLYFPMTPIRPKAQVYFV